MSELADKSERIHALERHDANFLVEAAAGTGKTALIAGRVVMMLSRGEAPKHIAALSYNEFAASELSERIGEYVHELIDGRVPAPLALALPDGVTADQKLALQSASLVLDELTSCTIHAFCQTLLTAYAIDADIDPGARILDAQAAETALDYVFDSWLDARLSGPEIVDDPIAHLAEHYPRGVARMLRKIAKLRLQYRTATAPEPESGLRPERAFAVRVGELRQWMAGAPADADAAATVEELEALAGHFENLFAESIPDFARLWGAAHPPQYNRLMAKPSPRKKEKNRNLKAPGLDRAWKTAGGQARELKQNFRDRYALCAEAYRSLMGHVASWVMWRVSGALDDLVAAYDTYKRRSALLDFDDLLYRARDLVRDNGAARASIVDRFRHILVDEFQDTDPIQAELFFRIAAKAPADDWTRCELRPGALFVVGDPKQAIYAFRGADVTTYDRACEAIEAHDKSAVLKISANFRSRPDIVDHVNACFEGPLSVLGQPSYTPLVATLQKAAHNHSDAARLTIKAPQGADAQTLRELEAAKVADLCARLIGRLPIKDRTLRAGEIALLAPAHTDLKIYEAALTERKLPFVSQAGKGLFKRQETQDVLALARTLADSADVLAFGALMRGPLIGFSDEELLDIAHDLPEVERGRARFSMFTDHTLVTHERAAAILKLLQSLSRRARATTPFLILSEALERLAVRANLAHRSDERGARSWANIEVVLERSRPFAVSGLAKFASALTRDWLIADNTAEGRLDADEGAIQIVTMHSAKGLEWPVVMPINSSTWVWSPRDYVHRPDTNTLHWIIDDVRDPQLADALDRAAHAKRQENTRLWYVACTRARDLLIVPEIAEADSRSYARIVSLGQDRLDEWVMATYAPTSLALPEEVINAQSKKTFDDEQARIMEASKPARWHTPSDHDTDRLPIIELLAAEASDTVPATIVEGAGRLRGLVLHKLMEEVLTGEVAEEPLALALRAEELTAQLAEQMEAAGPLPAAKEMAQTVLATLAMPDIMAVRDRLHPELSLYAELGPNDLLAGRADAVACDEAGAADIVFDWKSDVDPTDLITADHASQLSAYLEVTGAQRGALVYMTRREIRWINRPD